MRPIHLFMPLLLLLAACGTAPASRFYVLTPGQVSAPQNTTPSVGIGPVSVPEFLERDMIITGRQESHLEIASNHRWAEPLAEGIGRVTAINVAALLDTQSMQRFPWRQDYQPDYAVKIDLWQLETTDYEAQLIAQWTVQHRASDNMLLKKISHLSAPLGDSEKSVDAIPAAISQLLYELSQEIARVIARANNSVK